MKRLGKLLFCACCIAQNLEGTKALLDWQLCTVYFLRGVDRDSGRPEPSDLQEPGGAGRAGPGNGHLRRHCNRLCSPAALRFYRCLQVSLSATSTYEVYRLCIQFIHMELFNLMWAASLHFVFAPRLHMHLTSSLSWPVAFSNHLQWTNA